MKSLNARVLLCWTLYCIVGCGLLPEMVIGARYLPTRRSIPTQLERNERLRELFQHILESERDAHLSAANQFADELKLIQKKSNEFGLLPETFKDYNDDVGGGGGGGAVDDEYDDRMEHPQYDGRKLHFQQQQKQQQQRQKQPWRFVLLNYGHGAHRNRKPDQTNAKSLQHSPLTALSGSNVDEMVTPRSQQQQQQQLIQKLYRQKQQKPTTTNTNADNSDMNTNDLDWITSNTELNNANDYDALYDDVNEKRSSSSSSSNLKFDRFRRNGPMAEQKEHLN